MAKKPNKSLDPNWRRLTMLRPRLILSLATGAAIAWVGTGGWSPTVRLIVGWDTAMVIYFVLLGFMMGRATPQEMRDRAEALDAGRWLMLALTALAAAASLGAIATELPNLHDMPRDQRTLHVVLVGVTIVASWLFLHVMFAIHYAHDYYFHPRHGDLSRPPGGLDFPNDTHPDYWDFCYFSFVVGMTCQVSDVAVKSKMMRRLTLAHGVLAFFFNTVVLALMVNVTASLL
jgi:uncharacterized membrane protein